MTACRYRKARSGLSSAKPNACGKRPASTRPRAVIPRSAEASPLMNPCPKAVGSVVSRARCAPRPWPFALPDRAGIRFEARRRIPALVPPVVVPRRHAGQTGDGALEPSEEAHRVERTIAPARRDAVVTVVGARMVSRVVTAAEQYA